MKVELVFDEFLKMLKRNKMVVDPIRVSKTSRKNNGNEHDRSRDIFSELHRTFSCDDKRDRSLIRTTCTAFRANILLETHFPWKSKKIRFKIVSFDRRNFFDFTRVNLLAVSKARVTSLARRKYFVDLQLTNRSAVSIDWASSIQTAADSKSPQCWKNRNRFLFVHLTFSLERKNLENFCFEHVKLD